MRINLTGRYYAFADALAPSGLITCILHDKIQNVNPFGDNMIVMWLFRDIVLENNLGNCSAVCHDERHFVMMNGETLIFNDHATVIKQIDQSFVRLKRLQHFDLSLNNTR